MDPPPRRLAGTPPTAPRARGDGPLPVRPGARADGCSPRTRGWTRGQSRRGLRVAAAPRARGDGPVRRGQGKGEVACSPRTRGWTPRSSCCAALRPHPPSCSPRTRGWTHSQGAGREPGTLLPAHAGMDPSQARRRAAGAAAPRARGDGPVHQLAPRTRLLLPAQAGRGEGGPGVRVGCVVPQAWGSGPRSECRAYPAGGAVRRAPPGARRRSHRCGRRGRSRRPSACAPHRAS